jgi:hypothetical protein
MVIIDDSDMIDHRSMIDDGHIPGLIDIIVTDIRTADILVGNKTPAIGRRHITTAIRHVEADAGTHGSPSIVFVAVTPGHPGRSILITGYPHPAIPILEEPAAIVEGGPAPGIVGSPGPSFIGIDPMTIGGIRLKIRTHIRQPDIPVTGVVYPLSIRTQIVIKGLIGRFRLRLGRWRRQRICYRRLRRRDRLLDHISRTTGIQTKGQNG